MFTHPSVDILLNWQQIAVQTIAATELANRNFLLLPGPMTAMGNGLHRPLKARGCRVYYGCHRQSVDADVEVSHF